MISADVIGFLKRSQKTRVSSATSREGGGTVGINSCAGLVKPCERSSYATQRFLVQARHRKPLCARQSFSRRYNFNYASTTEIYSLSLHYTLPTEQLSL